MFTYCDGCMWRLFVLGRVREGEIYFSAAHILSRKAATCIVKLVILDMKGQEGGREWSRDDKMSSSK